MSYLSVADVAKRLNVSKMTVYRMVDRREIPALQFGRNVRIAAVELEHYITAHTTEIEEAQ